MLIDSKKLAGLARIALENMKGQDVEVLDVRTLSGVTDFFVMVTGNSAPHIKALAEDVATALKKDGVRCYRKSGTPESEWIAMDFVDVVVHIFSADTRAYYALEELWSDAERIA